MKLINILIPNISLGTKDFVWHLRIGVVGGGPDRQSHIRSERPYMGLLEVTTEFMVIGKPRRRSFPGGGLRVAVTG